MRHTKVGGLMTDGVVTAVPATSFKEVAKLLAEHDTSGVPVVDEDDRAVEWSAFRWSTRRRRMELALHANRMRRLRVDPPSHRRDEP